MPPSQPTSRFVDKILGLPTHPRRRDTGGGGSRDGWRPSGWSRARDSGPGGDARRPHARLMLAFLIVGDVRDGAPTHHPARALSPLWWCSWGWAWMPWARRIGEPVVESQRACCRRLRGLHSGRSWCVSMPPAGPTAPGRSDSERRDAQLRALDLPTRRRPADVTPCALRALRAWMSSPEPARTLSPRAFRGTPPERLPPRVCER